MARELKLERKLLYTWKYQFEGRPEPRHANLGTTAEERKDKQQRDEIARLKLALGLGSETAGAAEEKHQNQSSVIAPGVQSPSRASTIRFRHTADSERVGC